MLKKHLVVINQSFGKEEVNKNKVVGVIWHKGVCGKQDEDVTHAFIKALRERC